MNTREMLRELIAKLSMPLHQKWYWFEKLENMDTSWIEKLYLALTAKNPQILQRLAMVEKAHIKHLKQELHTKVSEGVKELQSTQQ